MHNHLCLLLLMVVTMDVKVKVDVKISLVRRKRQGKDRLVRGPVYPRCFHTLVTNIPPSERTRDHLRRRSTRLAHRGRLRRIDQT
jgi:hypothetical protein